MQIQNIAIDEISEYGNNPRKNEKAIEAVQNSIASFGFKVPIVIDKNKVIIAGNTRLIINITMQGDIVLDPFGGSGTTLIACENQKRVCYMCELDEVYCDVIIKRLENLTGGKAVKFREKITT